jgi:hypothetical protein
VKVRRNTYGRYQSLLWGLHGSYLKITPVGVPQGLFFMAKMKYFRATGMIFLRLALL